MEKHHNTSQHKVDTEIFKNIEMLQITGERLRFLLRLILGMKPLPSGVTLVLFKESLSLLSSQVNNVDKQEVSIIAFKGFAGASLF